MNKNEQLDKIDRTIKDLEIRLSGIRTSLGQIENELSVLSPKKTELEQNLRFQKKEGTIPIAHEYKKIKIEFSRVSARLILITTEQKKATNVLAQIETHITKLKNDQIKLIKSFENNVLQVTFGGNRGKE